MSDYDADYEECMGCTTERCRGGGFLDVKLANGKVGMICSNCTKAAVGDAIKRGGTLTMLRLKEVAGLVKDTAAHDIGPHTWYKLLGELPSSARTVLIESEDRGTYRAFVWED